MHSDPIINTHPDLEQNKTYVITDYHGMHWVQDAAQNLLLH